MFVTHKSSKVTDYTKVEKSGETVGGGVYVSPQGGGYGLGPCGEDCIFDPGYTPEDTRHTGIENYTNSYGYCGFSRSYACNRQGHCAVGTQGGTGVSISKSPYNTYTSSAKLFKVTCVGGLTSTQTGSENPYTKTAEQACTTSKNKGKDVPFAGRSVITTLDCPYAALSGALSLYAGGLNFPAVLDTDKTTTYCAQIHENGQCIDEQDCTGVAVMPTYYDGYCAQADARFGACLPVYKTVNPSCPIYYEPDCESAYILSKPGNYITTGSKNIGSFSTASVYALSIDKAVEFSMSTGKASPKIGQTFSYINNEIKYNGLKEKESTYTNSYIFIGESGASTTTYKIGAGGYEGGGAPTTLFYSGEFKATAEGQVWKTTGPGSNPCCQSNCDAEEVSEATTDTLFAGSSFQFTHSAISTTQLGNYVAYQPTSIIRKDHLAWGEFGYSTSAGGKYNSNWQEKAEFGCGSRYLAPNGEGDMLYDCCVGGMVPRPLGGQTKVGSSKCWDINCGCTSNSAADTTAREGAEPIQTQCFDPCASNFFGPDGPPDECVAPFVSPGGETCCPKKFFPNYDISEKQLQNQINRNGECAVVNSMSLDVAYTHYTRAQTLTTGIGFQDGGFQVTLQKSEGLYFLDSKGSMQTATSFSLKQSKSDIANSHVGFAFSGVYYNPMGRTTQFGSDGAKKTFIALATGDAVYLVGSPDGKTKGTATASHDGDVHSYYISDPDAKKIWNQASWPGHGVVNGKITTGTFSFSFNTGAFANRYGENGSIARFLPGAKQTIVAHGGLNVISSKDNVSENSFKTTYSTKAFSTSFDSTFKGAWIAKAVPYTYVATKSVGYDLNPFVDIETTHVISINCPGCDFPQPAIPYGIIDDTSAYFIKGNKSLIYNDNAKSYLWTHPAFKKVWGAGHAGDCEE